MDALLTCKHTHIQLCMHIAQYSIAVDKCIYNATNNISLPSYMIIVLSYCICAEAIMQSAAAHSRYTGDLESIDLVLYNNSEASPKHQEEISRHENRTTQDNGRNVDEAERRSVHVAPDDETKRLWKRCNTLLRFEQQLTKPYFFCACIHLCVLVSVTISASTKTISDNYYIATYTI